MLYELNHVVCGNIRTVTVKTGSPIILMPNYENNSSILTLISHIKSNLEVFQLVIVDDGSIENKLDLKLLESLAVPLVVINLKKNGGPQKAIATGLNYIYNNLSPELVIIMDSDGEDSPNDLNKLLRFKELNSEAHIVVATRISRKNSFGFKLLYRAYKNIFRIATGKSMNFGHFSLIDKIALERLVNYSELWMHLGSTYILSNLKISYLPIPRDVSYSGKQMVNPSRLINHGIRSLVVLSELFVPRIFIISSIMLFVNTTFLIFVFLYQGFVPMVYFGILLSILVFFAIVIIALFLGIARSSGEYNAVSYESLILEVLSV